MIKFLVSVAVLLLGILSANAYASDEPVHPGKVHFDRCAACHLPDGAGVLGLYPPLKEQVRDIASTQTGREYLAFVVLKGLAGEIVVDGTTYRGMMPAVTGGLDDQALADLLDYLITVVAAPALEVATDDLASEETPSQTRISAERMKELRSDAAAHSHASIRKVRADALDLLSNQASAEGGSNESR